MSFDFKFLCVNREQAEVVLRQSVLRPFLKEVLEHLKKLPCSVIFLNRVGKKEAPDYYEIIKNPMDLATMGKRLHLYRSLDEFKSDVDLIVSNCRIYNTAEYFLECANEFMAEAYSFLLKYQRVYPLIPESFAVACNEETQDTSIGESTKGKIKKSLARYFKAVGFERCEKKCVDIMCEVVGYKLVEFIKGIPEFESL